MEELKRPDFPGQPFPSGWDNMYPEGPPPGQEGWYEHSATKVRL